MDEELPYKAEYSKSGRASCRGCKNNIAKDVLRMAVMVQSPMFDGKVPHWYHRMCFFAKQRPASVGDIACYESLRYEDQQKIKEKIESAGPAPGPSKVKGKGKSQSSGAYKDFSVEIAKSGRASCRGCEVNILKDEVRISKLDYSSDKAKRFGPMPRWHHTECFMKLREELQFYGAGSDLPGFKQLPADVQKNIKESITLIKRKAEDEMDGPPVKKIKAEDEQLAKTQNTVMFKYRDNLRVLSKRELSSLIEHNVESFDGTGGESEMLDWLADLMAFGVPLACKECGNTEVKFKSGKGYTCKGYITEYTRCTNVERAPQRKTFEVPEELAAEYPFLAKYKSPKLGDRYFVEYSRPSQEMVKTESDTPRTEAPKRKLAGLSICVTAAKYESGRKPADLKAVIKKHGGTTTTAVMDSTAVVITTREFLDKRGKAIKVAEELDIQCIEETFLDEVEAGKDAMHLIKTKAISDWGEDPQERIKKSQQYKSAQKSLGSTKVKQKSEYTKSMPDKLKIKLKAGGAVDPDSGLSDCCHVLTYKGKLYNTVLGLVDLTRGTNAYYRIQVLESDSNGAWWVFRSWGRIGTTIGGNKLEDMEDKQDAIRHFHSLFEDRTGNSFTRDEFVKIPGKYTVMDLDYDDQDKISSISLCDSKSKLPKPVQELVSLIFDVNTMKSQMVEFEIDLKKLPLGKLSKKQLNTAYSVLTECQNILNTDSKDNANKVLDCSNRFYSLIPHDFGMDRAPLLNNLDLIKNKIDMIDSLMEIEIAYNLMKSSADGSDEGVDPIDAHYGKLNTKMEPLEKDGEEFKLLSDYVKNTHGSTHSHYKLKVEEAFKVERNGEAKRFKPFKKLPNHKLLWHGSRLTNFAGILSQGLRIAPPEAPVTGYMFGKGIYFADMVSKSANYCSTNISNNTGLMLLCDVALGNMYECTGAEYVTKLPTGKHSTKGCGRTMPDPTSSVTHQGIEVPIGKGINDADHPNSSLLYNEYIVYDVAQVQVKYLLRMNFDYCSTY